MSMYSDIFEAAKKGTAEDVRYFIEKEGVDVNLEDPSFNDETPLHTASYYGNIEVVKYLISNGANIKAKDVNGFTPLHKAAIDTGHEINDTGKLEVAKYLVSNGANVNAIGPHNLKPLDMAMAGRWRYELRQYLESVGGRSSKSSNGGSDIEIGTILKWVGIDVGVIVIIMMCSR